MLRRLHPDCCPGTLCILPVMHQIVLDDPGTLERPHDTGLLPLHHACKCLHVHCVKFLLKSGADVTSECPNSGNTAIYYTLFGGDRPRSSRDPVMYEIIELLLKFRKNGAKIYKNEENFKTDLTMIIDSRMNSILQLLLENGEFIINMLPENDFPKIYSLCFGFVSKAILFKNLEAVKLLILHGNGISNYIFKNRQFSGTPTKILKVYKSESLRPLQIFHNFGGNLRTNHQPSGQNREVKNILEYIRDSQFPYPAELEQQVEKMMNNPLSLKAQCRLQLWRILGTEYWWKIKFLEVPDEVLDFLQLKHL